MIKENINYKRKPETMELQVNTKELGENAGETTNCTEEVIEIIVKAPCCAKHCLVSLLPYCEAVQLVHGCINEVNFRAPNDKRTYILNKLKQLPHVSSHKGYYRIGYVVGVTPNPVLRNVCKICFQNCYGYEKSTINYLIKAMKRNITISHKPYVNNDITRIADHTFLNEIILLMKREHNNILSYEELAMLKIPNNSGAMLCYSWMKYFFNLVGDHAPNSDQIHLEPQSIYEIYAEYYATISHSINKLNLKYFYKLWKLCWPHVKIRRYKAVCGKCTECALFSNLRQQCKSEKGRIFISALHSYHRITYMGERRCYNDRIVQSHTSPEKYLSVVSDTMAQNHMMLPWLGNMAQPKVCLPQKMTGVLCHNRCFIGYRFFHNVGGGANSSIYCMLRTLERIKNMEGKLPETFYYQVDGGAENSNLATLGICELLVARRVVEKIVITRLMVGHTHSDIDAYFGVIWKKIRDATILTPQQYEEAIKDALGKVGIPIIIEDVFVVPDYQSYIHPHMLDITQAFKLKYTKLQWIFEYVELCESCINYIRPHCQKCADFPSRVKVTYRAYSADKVWEFSKNADENLNVQPESVIVTVEPQGKLEYNVPEGMFVLESLPDSKTPLKPAPFITGGRQLLELTADKVTREYQHFGPAVLPDWTSFVKLCPETDIASDFIEKNPERFHIPLHQELFSDSAISLTHVPSRTINKRNTEQNPTMKTTASVKWPNRGINIPLPTSTREYVDGRVGDPDMITLDNCDTHQTNYNSWTTVKLRSKCKALGISTRGTKQVLIDSINTSLLKKCNLDVLKGYSNNKNIYVQLSTSKIDDVVTFFKSIISNNNNIAINQRESLRQWICSEAYLKFYIKHDDKLYYMCQPDGTCSWQLVDVMKCRSELNLVNRDDCLQIANIDYSDTKLKVQLTLKINGWVNRIRSLTSNEDIVMHFISKANAYIRFISNFDRNKKSTLSLRKADWLHSDAIPFISDSDYPFSIFISETTNNKNSDYLLLESITNRGGYRQFPFDAIHAMCISPNFACVHNGHAYPLPSAESYSMQLNEAIDELLNELMNCEVINIVTFLESEINLKRFKKVTSEYNIIDLLGDNSDAEDENTEEIAEEVNERNSIIENNVDLCEVSVCDIENNNSESEYPSTKIGTEQDGRCDKNKKSVSKGKDKKKRKKTEEISSEDSTTDSSPVNVRSNRVKKPLINLNATASYQSRRGKIRKARVRGENKRREMENELDGTLDYSIVDNSINLIHRQVEDTWVNKEGVEESYIGEVISFNAKTKKYLVQFSTGDEEPVPWEYSAKELVKIILA